jgi:hypothetical protein
MNLELKVQLLETELAVCRTRLAASKLNEGHAMAAWRLAQKENERLREVLRSYEEERGFEAEAAREMSAIPQFTKTDLVKRVAWQERALSRRGQQCLQLQEELLKKMSSCAHTLAKRPCEDCGIPVFRPTDWHDIIRRETGLDPVWLCDACERKAAALAQQIETGGA